MSSVTWEPMGILDAFGESHRYKARSRTAFGVIGNLI